MVARSTNLALGLGYARNGARPEQEGSTKRYLHVPRRPGLLNGLGLSMSSASLP